MNAILLKIVETEDELELSNVGVPLEIYHKHVSKILPYAGTNSIELVSTR